MNILQNKSKSRTYMRQFFIVIMIYSKHLNYWHRLEYTDLCEGIHVTSLGLCHKVSRLTWWNLGGSEWKLSGRNWYECLISVITCYNDANLQFTREYMGKTAYIRPNYCKIRAKERFWSCFWGEKVLRLDPKTPCKNTNDWD